MKSKNVCILIIQCVVFLLFSCQEVHFEVSQAHFILNDNARIIRDEASFATLELVNQNTIVQIERINNPNELTADQLLEEILDQQMLRPRFVTKGDLNDLQNSFGEEIVAGYILFNGHPLAEDGDLLLPGFEFLAYIGTVCSSTVYASCTQISVYGEKPEAQKTFIEIVESIKIYP